MDEKENIISTSCACGAAQDPDCDHTAAEPCLPPPPYSVEERRPRLSSPPPYEPELRQFWTKTGPLPEGDDWDLIDIEFHGYHPIDPTKPPITMMETVGVNMDFVTEHDDETRTLHITVAASKQMAIKIFCLVDDFVHSLDRLTAKGLN